MDNTDKYFKGQQQDETFICFFRKHWISLIREMIYFVLFIVAVTIPLFQFDEIRDLIQTRQEIRYVFVLFFALGTFAFHRSFIKFFNYFVSICIITDKRIVDNERTLFFKDDLDSIDMSQIQDIEMIANGILPNFLNYGDLKIYLSATNAVKHFKAVPNAKFHFRCINRQKEALKQNLLRKQGSTGFTPQLYLPIRPPHQQL